MRVLVTGAAGFLGRAVLARLAAEPHVRVVASDRVAAPAAAAPGAGAAWRVADLLAPGACADLVGDAAPDVVLHLAGAVVGPPAALLAANATATAELLDAVERRAPRAHLVVIGSAAEYAPPGPGVALLDETAPCDPVSPYGASKRAATALALAYARTRGLRVTIVRPFNLIGAGTPPSLLLGALVARLRDALASGGPPSLTVGNTHPVRDFLDVEDAAEYLWRLAGRAGDGEVLNLCAGTGVAVHDVVAAVVAHAPVDVAVRHDSALARGADVPRVVGDTTRLRAATGYLPRVPLQESVRRAWTSACAAVAPVSPSP